MAVYQRAYAPTDHIFIGQGYGADTSTHLDGYPLDLSGDYKLFAPFDCKVTGLYVPRDKKGKLQTNHSFEVWLTSTKKVLCANGYYGYLTISITHPYNIYKLKKGQTFKQFESLGISTTKMTGVHDGNHAHLEVSLGKVSGWDKKLMKKGVYVNANAVKPEEYLFITEKTKVVNEKYKSKKTKKVTTYHFKKESEMTYIVFNVPSEPLYIRSKKLHVVIGKLYNGDEVIKFNNDERCLVYHYGSLGLTYKKYLEK